jgi:hypothetical protein
VARQGPGRPRRWMTVHDRIRLTGLLRKGPAPAGLFYAAAKLRSDRRAQSFTPGQALLGEPVRGRYHLGYCGGGNLKRCRKLLWAALDQAGLKLTAAQGPNPAAWRASAVNERIRFVPGLLPFTMRYTNRPTGIQQIVSFSGHAPADRGR